MPCRIGKGILPVSNSIDRIEIDTIRPSPTFILQCYILVHRRSNQKSESSLEFMGNCPFNKMWTFWNFSGYLFNTPDYKNSWFFGNFVINQNERILLFLKILLFWKSRLNWQKCAEIPTARKTRYSRTARANLGLPLSLNFYSIFLVERPA